jgi:hypothetical protein
LLWRNLAEFHGQKDLRIAVLANVQHGQQRIFQDYRVAESAIADDAALLKADYWQGWQIKGSVALRP